jgi:hypothetical protein
MSVPLIIDAQRNYDLKDGTARRCFLVSDKSANGPFWLESLAMALYVRELDIDTNVVWIKSEPGLMWIPYKGDRFKYHPDFEVGYRDSRVSIIEVKSAAKRGDEELKERFRHVRQYCRQGGREFELIFSDRLYRQPKRRNVALIHYYRNTPVSELDLGRVLRRLESEPEMRIADLVRACPDLTPQKLYALTAKGHLWVNLFRPVDETASIRRRSPITMAA